MIIVMQPDADDAAIAAVEAKIRAHGLDVHISRGTERTLIGAVGDERKLEPEMFDPMPGVEKSMHIVKPYKLVAREWHKANTIVVAGGMPFGGNDGPGHRRPVLGRDRRADGRGGRRRRGGRRAPDARRRVQAAHLALRVPGQGRGGPQAPQGRGRRRAALPVVTELMDVRMLDTFLEHGVDVIQIGTRNMQNFDLLKAVGQVDDAGDPEARHERDDRRMADGGASTSPPAATTTSSSASAASARSRPPTATCSTSRRFP